MHIIFYNLSQGKSCVMYCGVIYRGETELRQNLRRRLFGRRGRLWQAAAPLLLFYLKYMIISFNVNTKKMLSCGELCGESWLTFQCTRTSSRGRSRCGSSLVDFVSPVSLRFSERRVFALEDERSTMQHKGLRVFGVVRTNEQHIFTVGETLNLVERARLKRNALPIAAAIAKPIQLVPVISQVK